MRTISRRSPSTLAASPDFLPPTFGLHTGLALCQPDTNHGRRARGKTGVHRDLGYRCDDRRRSSPRPRAFDLGADAAGLRGVGIRGMAADGGRKPHDARRLATLRRQEGGGANESAFCRPDHRRRIQFRACGLGALPGPVAADLARTRRSSPSSARPSAATASRPSVCRTFAGAPRSAWARDRDWLNMSWDKRAAPSRPRSRAPRSEATPMGCRRRPRRQPRPLRRPSFWARPRRQRQSTRRVELAATLTPGAVSATAGGGLPHENRQPSLTINYIISLFGMFPSQN